MSSNDKYLSFKTSRMNPLAESTAIGSPIGLNQTPENFRGNQKRKPTSPLSQDKQRQLKLQIEPHILTNAQSPGIVKRLISYYGESQGEADKNRYVYNRVGDFPLVQLKKNEIKRNLTRSSSVRIAPPNKAVMNRDVRAAILRSNSFQLGSNVPKLVPTKMRAKDDLHQIITNHDPLPTIESAQSAKSVLDALEKNCRKRINNEELTLDRNKRVCAPAQLEVVDAPSTREFLPIAPQSSKRGRDQISPIKTGGDSPNAQKTKKLRIRNNALLSSLSSSHFVLKPHSVVSSPSLPTPTKSSMTTLKETSNAIEQQEKRLKEFVQLAEKRSSESPPKSSTEKRLYLFNRKVDPSSYSLRNQDDDDDDEIKINFVKPRETVSSHDSDIIQQAEQEKLSMMLLGLSDGFKSPLKETPKDLVDSVPASISFKTVTTTSSVGPIASPALTTSPVPLSVETSSTSKSTETGKVAEKAEKVVLPTVVAQSVTVATKTSESETPKTLLNFQFGATSSEKPAVSTSTALPVDNAATTVEPSTSVASTVAVIPSGKLSPLISSSKSNSSDTNVFGNSIGQKVSAPFSFKTSNGVVAPNTSPPNTFVQNQSASLAPPPAGGFSFQGQQSVLTPQPSPGGELSDTNVFGKKIGQNVSAPFSFKTSNDVVAPNTSPPNTFVQNQSASLAPPPAFQFGQQVGNNVSTSYTFGGTSANTSSNSAVSNGLNFNGPQTAPVADGFNFLGQQSVLTSQPSPEGGLSDTNVFGKKIGQNVSAHPFSFKTSNSVVAPNTSSPNAFGQNQSASLAKLQGYQFGQQVGNNASTSYTFGGTSANTSSNSAVSNGFNFNGPQTAPVADGFNFLGQQSVLTSQPSIESGLSDTNVFGKKIGQNVSAPFSFKTSNSVVAPNTSSPNAFGQNQSASLAKLPGYQFGQQVGNNASTSYTFGGTSANTSSNSAVSNGFNFNKPQTAPVADGFNFLGQQSVLTPQPSPGGGLSDTNVFGKKIGQNVSASFSFKTSNGVAAPNTSPPNAFGQNQSASLAPPPAYQFGQQVGNNVSTSYTFGGSSANTSSNSNGFNFNGPQTASVAGGFNFQGQQSVLTPQPSPGSGLFNIGTSGNNQQQRRPIRQATRRMK